MSTKYTGGFITKSPVAPTSSAASGVWTLDQQQQYQKAGTWPSPPIFIEDLFSTFLYTGNGATQTITNGIDVSGKGGLVWAKSRSNVIRHSLFDTARGANYQLSTNNTEPSTNAFIGDTAISFTSTGFTTGSFVNTNTNAATYVSWTFAEQPKFFDIVTWTGDLSGNRTLNHNLASTPGCIIVKATNATDDWYVYHTSLGTSKFLYLDTTGSQVSASVVTAVTDTTFTVSQSNGFNTSGRTYIAYLFAHNAGGFPVSGGGSTNGITCGSVTIDGGGQATVNLGYEPQWILYKSSTDVQNWYIYDTVRGMPVGTSSGPYSQALSPNAETAEFLGAAFAITSTGFNIQTSIAGATYIYVAIRRGPMKPPTVGTSVFSPLTYTGDGTSGRYISGAGFPPDLIIQTARSASENREFDDRLRGGGSTAMNALFSNSSNAEAADSGSVQLLNQDGFTVRSFGNGSSVTYIGECFRRAPSFFDEVCYTGTGSARTITHNLGAVPELMIVKRRDAAANWPVYTASTATNEYLFLNSGGLPTTATTVWNNTAPTSSVFSVGTSALTNASAGTYVAYLFSSCAGVSKVGSYTGTGALQTINCGFTSGARFVLIKLISSGTSGSGDWYVWDSARGISSGNDPYLLLDSTSAEVTGTNYVDTDTTGFKVTAAGATDINASGDIYLFLAIA